MTAPDQATPAVLVEAANGQLVRIGHDASRLRDILLQAPTISDSEVSQLLGPPWAPDLAQATREQLEGLELLSESAETRPKRVQFRPPFSLQISLLDPSVRLRWLAGVARVVLRSRIRLLFLSVAAAGLVLLGTNRQLVDDSLGSSISLKVYAAILISLLVSTFVHEMAHAGVLMAYGETPRRMGVMLFYLSPAFFCDVTGAWRLEPRQRVAVALAGVGAHATMGGVAVLLAYTVSGELVTGLVVFGLTCYVFALFNLVPFVKLDGYLALATWLDISHLRRKSIDDFWAWVSFRLLGGHRREPTRIWTPLFGFVSLVVPIVLIMYAILAARSLLMALAKPGAVALFALIAGLSFYALRLAVRRTVRVLREGARPLRVACWLLVIVLGVSATLSFTTMHNRYVGGITQTDGSWFVVFPIGTVSKDGIAVGMEIVIHSGGLVLGDELGQAHVTGPAVSCEVPLEAIVPITGSALTAQAQCVPIELISELAPQGATLRAVVHQPGLSPSGWARQRVLQPAIESLTS